MNTDDERVEEILDENFCVLYCWNGGRRGPWRRKNGEEHWEDDEGGVKRKQNKK